MHYRGTKSEAGRPVRMHLQQVIQAKKQQYLRSAVSNSSEKSADSSHILKLEPWEFLVDWLLASRKRSQGWLLGFYRSHWDGEAIVEQVCGEVQEVVQFRLSSGDAERLPGIWDGAQSDGHLHVSGIWSRISSLQPRWIQTRKEQFFLLLTLLGFPFDDLKKKLNSN